jgi:hypothetical protein
MDLKPTRNVLFFAQAVLFAMLSPAAAGLLYLPGTSPALPLLPRVSDCNTPTALRKDLNGFCDAMMQLFRAPLRESNAAL